MLYLKHFESFLLESTSRAPLYHFTYQNKLNRIFIDDLLKSNRPYLTRPNMPQESISVTRNKYYSERRFYKFRIKLDTNKLLAAGFKPIPINEFNLSVLKDVGPDYNIPTQQEEERIYKSIPNIGKYITDIDISDLFSGFKVEDIINNIPQFISNLEDTPLLTEDIKLLINYLLKYPHINFNQTWNWKPDKNSRTLNAQLITSISEKK